MSQLAIREFLRGLDELRQRGDGHYKLAISLYPIDTGSVSGEWHFVRSLKSAEAIERCLNDALVSLLLEGSAPSDTTTRPEGA